MPPVGGYANDVMITDHGPVCMYGVTCNWLGRGWRSTFFGADRTNYKSSSHEARFQRYANDVMISDPGPVCMAPGRHLANDVMIASTRCVRILTKRSGGFHGSFLVGAVGWEPKVQDARAQAQYA